MSADTLIEALVGAGLLQFGAFDLHGKRVPYQFRLELLPSYPAVLRQAAELVSELIEPIAADRLICTRDATALAALLSQKGEIPLVVHHSDGESAGRRLVGAYDIGHPAILISLTTDIDDGTLTRLVRDAASVGLELMHWVSLAKTAPTGELRHSALLDVAAAAKYLAEKGEISSGLAARVAAARPR